MTPADQGICPFKRGLNSLFYHASKRYLCSLLVSTSLIVAISKGRGSLLVSRSQVGSNLSEVQSKSIELPHTPPTYAFSPTHAHSNSPGDVGCLFDTRRRPTKGHTRRIQQYKTYISRLYSPSSQRGAAPGNAFSAMVLEVLQEA